MKELGLQAAARIAASSEPLRALTQTAQNFPNLAAALSRMAVPKQLRSELKKLHRVLQGGARHICSPNFSSLSEIQTFVLHAHLLDAVQLLRRPTARRVALYNMLND